MRVIVYDETKDAMQDARWCYVPKRAAPTYTMFMSASVVSNACHSLLWVAERL